MAGRGTLIKSVTSTIPSYSMQTTWLPQSTCDKIDKLNRNFLWGDTEEKKKVHLINWDTVCKSKEKDGLGLKKTRVNNLATLSKLGWNIKATKDNL